MLTFSASREDLSLAIQRASQGLAGNPPQPIYAGMLFKGNPNGIEITASDGDMTFSAGLSAEVHSDENHDNPGEPGQALLPGKMIAEISRYFTGTTITVDYQDGGTAEITAGRAKFTLSADKGLKYPKWQDPPQMIGTIDAEEFAGAIRRVAPAASKTHPVHRSIYLHPDSLAVDRLFIVATDSSRMAVMVPSWEDTGPLRTFPDPLVPVPVMERFAKAAADEDFVQLGWNDKMIGFSTPGLQVTSRLNSGTFPKNWRGILDGAPENWVTFSAESLTRVVKMALLAADEGRIDLTFEGSDLHVTASQQGREFSDYVDTDYSGEPVTLLLGGQVLLDGLSGCRGEAKITFTTPARPVFLRSGDYRYMCQPRRDMKEEANG